jgi:oxygen tolerance protein BatD
VVRHYRRWLAYIFDNRHCSSKGVLVAILLAISLPLQAGSLVSQVDRQQISLGETLTLTLTLDKQVLFGEPEFSSLETDFEIINRNRQSRYSNANGKKQSYTQWILTLSPKQTGQLIIPSFSFKGEVSDAFEIKVSKPVASTNSNAQIFSEAILEKNSVYVQEQALLTLRLLTAVPLSNFEMSEVVIPDATVIKLAENQYQKRVSGKDYIVVETQFAIFAENSGELIIPPVRYSSIARLSFNRKRIAVNTEEQALSVKPQPSAANNINWLPAREINLSDNWGKDLPTLTVGEPVTRTITLSAQGLTAAQLPPLVIDQSPGFKLYNDQAQLEDNINTKGVIGRRVESMAIVPSEAGSLTLPEVRVQWWDTTNDHMRTSVLASVTFQVLPGADSTLSQATPPFVSPKTNAGATLSDTGDQPENKWVIAALGAANVLLALMAITFAILWWRGRGSVAGLTPGKGDPNQTPNRASLKAVHMAAAASDYAALRDAIIQWASDHWRDTSIHTLHQVATRAENEALGSLFQKLDTCLYKKSGTQGDEPDIKSLVKHLEEVQKIPISSKNGSKKNRAQELLPLYPETS